MLVDEPGVLHCDRLLLLIGSMGPQSSENKRLQQGVYLINHFGGSDFLSAYEHYPDIPVGPYGVCDSPEQLLELCKGFIHDPQRQFVCVLHRLTRSTQPKEGGWRWHKWGEYIGTQDPQCEYLADEPNIETVYTFHIYERL